MSRKKHGGALLLLLTVGCSQTAAPISTGVITASGSMPAAMKDGSKLAVAETGDVRRPGDEVVTTAWWRDYQSALRAHAQMLAGRADGRSQIAAAWLRRLAGNDDQGPDGQDPDDQGQEDAAFAALLVHAGDLAPDDPLIGWLERLGCPATQPACRPQQALARLQRLDPDNVATALEALADAVAAADPAAADRALAQAGRAGFYDSYWGEAGHFLDASLAAVPLPPRSASVLAAQRRQAGGVAYTDADLRAIAAIAMASAMTMPGLQHLLTRCRSDDAVIAAARRLSCLAVAARLAESDTLLGRRIGLGLAVRLTAGLPTGAAWREALRRFLWLQQQATSMGSRVPRGYAPSVWRVGEIAALQAWMLSTGRALTPPPGWLPASLEERALIATGHTAPRG